MKTPLWVVLLAAFLLSPARAQDDPTRQAWRSLTPQQQEKILENNKRFRALPPEDQARLRERYARFKGLSPEERKALIDGYQAAHQPAQTPSAAPGKAKDVPAEHDRHSSPAREARERSERREARPPERQPHGR